MTWDLPVNMTCGLDQQFGTDHGLSHRLLNWPAAFPPLLLNPLFVRASLGLFLPVFLHVPPLGQGLALGLGQADQRPLDHGYPKEPERKKLELLEAKADFDLARSQLEASKMIIPINKKLVKKAQEDLAENEALERFETRWATEAAAKLARLSTRST
jgi:hypothetical protein